MHCTHALRRTVRVALGCWPRRAQVPHRGPLPGLPVLEGRGRRLRQVGRGAAHALDEGPSGAKAARLTRSRAENHCRADPMQTAVQTKIVQGWPKIPRLGPTLSVKIPIRALKLAHTLGQPCATFRQPRPYVGNTSAVNRHHTPAYWILLSRGAPHALPPGLSRTWAIPA
jgi:hypothetical protein